MLILSWFFLAFLPPGFDNTNTFCFSVVYFVSAFYNNNEGIWCPEKEKTYRAQPTRGGKINTAATPKVFWQLYNSGEYPKERGKGGNAGQASTVK